MNKFMIAISALAMIATPSIAEARGNHGNDNGVSTEAAVAIGLGALILGGAIASNSRNRNYQNFNGYNTPRQYQLVCQNEYVRDYDGNYLLDQYGRAIFNQRCWYQ